MTISLRHEANRRAYARRIAACLRTSWAATPVPGYASVLEYAAGLSDDGWRLVFRQAGEEHVSEEPATMLEVLRALAALERTPQPVAEPAPSEDGWVVYPRRELPPPPELTPEERARQDHAVATISRGMAAFCGPEIDL